MTIGNNASSFDILDFIFIFNIRIEYLIRNMLNMYITSIILIKYKICPNSPIRDKKMS